MTRNTKIFPIVIASWNGGDLNGRWFPTTYRFKTHADALDKILELSRDGHDYRAFDDTHGLPETRNMGDKLL